VKTAVVVPRQYRWFILALGVLAQMTFAAAFGGIAVSGVLMRDSYRFSVGELGFVLGCMGLGVAISGIIWGILTDMLGDKVVLITGLTLMGVIFLSQVLNSCQRKQEHQGICLLVRY
jgi:MFS family permease